MSRFSVHAARVLWICAAQMFCLNSARATVVFIDVNNSMHEVETATAKAKARGEDILILPNPDEELSKEIKDTQKARTAKKKEYDKANCYGQMLCSGRFTSPNCTTLKNESIALEKKVDDLTLGKLTPESITAGIQSVYKSGKSVSSIILSGEDGGALFGTYGTLDYDQLKAAFAAVPQLKDDVHSLYLWGCYTGTADRYSSVWKDMFPGAKLMAGFHDAGPADTSDAGFKLLGKLMDAESEAFMSYGTDGAAKFFKKFGKEVSLLNVSMCINGQYIDKKNNFPLSEYQKTAQSCIDNFPKALRDKFNCYREAEEACPNPPKDHQAGDLREYYAYLRNNEICLNNPLFTNAVGSTGNPDNVIRLIYFDRVWDNFLANKAEDMKRLNTLIRATGLPDDLQFTCNNKMSRRELKLWMTKVNQKLAKDRDPKTQELKNIMNNLQSTVIGLSRWRVPDSWITGRSTEVAHYNFTVKADCKDAK